MAAGMTGLLIVAGVVGIVLVAAALAIFFFSQGRK